MSSTKVAYFSIDGGSNMLAQFNNVNNGGDAGDWSKNSPNQAQNAYGSVGTYADLNVEKVALDVIGYNFNDSPAPLPVPSIAPSSQTPTNTYITAPSYFVITPTYSTSLLAHPRAVKIQAAITAAIAAYQSIMLSVGTATIAFDIMSTGLGN